MIATDSACPRQSSKAGAGRLALGIVLVSEDFLERTPQSLLIYWRENCPHSRTPKLLVKILILNNKDVMEQSLFALVTTDPGFYRPTPAWGQTRTSGRVRVRSVHSRIADSPSAKTGKAGRRFYFCMFDQSQCNVRRVAIFASSMFEVVIIERGPARWEWQVCDSDGVQIMHGRETTRAEARYQGNRALFTLLVGGWKPTTHPKRQ